MIKIYEESYTDDFTLGELSFNFGCMLKSHLHKKTLKNFWHSKISCLTNEHQNKLMFTFTDNPKKEVYRDTCEVLNVIKKYFEFDTYFKDNNTLYVDIKKRKEV